MTTKEKYELFDKTKINEKVLGILKNMQESSKNFTDESVNSKIDSALDKLIENFRVNKPEALLTLPEAKKEVKKEKEKAIKKNKGKDFSEKKDTDDETGLPKKDNIEERKDIIKEESETEKEARDRAKKELEKEKEKAKDEVESQIEKLNRLILEDPALQGFNTGSAATGGGRSTPIIDAERKALPRGSRVSQKGWMNQYGASNGGRKYWENRENRSDRKSPEYETGKPYLENGGSIYDGMSETEFLKKYYGVNVFTENPSDYFDIQKLSSSNDNKINNFIEELKKDGYVVKKKAYSDFTSVMGVRRKMAKGGYVEKFYDKKSDVPFLFKKDEKIKVLQYDGGRLKKMDATIAELYPAEQNDGTYYPFYYIYNSWDEDKKYPVLYSEDELVVRNGNKPSKMADGGEVEGVDLFEDYDDQPEEVQAILANYEMEDNDYETLQNLKAELESIGYTMDFGLDAEPYDLRKIGQTGKSEFYAKGGEMADGGKLEEEISKIKSLGGDWQSYYKGAMAGKKDDGYVTIEDEADLNNYIYDKTGYIVKNIEVIEKGKNYPLNDSNPYFYDTYLVTLKNGSNFTFERSYGRPYWQGNVNYIERIKITNINTKYAKGGMFAEGSEMPDGYMDDETLLHEFKETLMHTDDLQKSIKEYYVNEFPTDDEGFKIEPDANFAGLNMVLNEGDDVYEYLGVSDSLVRERVFEKLSEILGVDYDVVYNMWLSGDKYNKGGETDGGDRMAHGGETDGKYTEYEMVVLSKDADGKSHKYRFLISARNIDEAKQTATDGWYSEFGDMGETFYKVMSDSKYRMDYGMADGGMMEDDGKLDGDLYKVGFIKVYEDGEEGDMVYVKEIYGNSEEEALSKFKKIHPKHKIEFISKYADGGMMADGGGVPYKPYGKTKGRFKLTYEVEGEPQSEIRQSLEEATDSARRYINPKLGYTNVHIYDESGKEYFFGDGGEVDFIERMAKMRSAYENLNMIVKSKIAMAVGIDRAISIMENDYSIDPFSLIISAVRGGLLELDEINKDLVNEAVYEAENVTDDYRDSGQGISGSDMTAFTKNVLDSAGYKTGFINNRLERVDEEGNKLEIDKYNMNY
jgi:hypothetical protein